VAGIYLMQSSLQLCLLWLLFPHPLKHHMLPPKTHLGVSGIENRSFRLLKAPSSRWKLQLELLMLHLLEEPTFSLKVQVLLKDQLQTKFFLDQRNLVKLLQVQCSQKKMLLTLILPWAPFLTECHLCGNSLENQRKCLTTSKP